METGTDIRERIVKKPDLIISRIPSKTLELFKSLSEEDFCGDYGMTLKFLMDMYEGVIVKGNEHLEQEILILQSRVADLEKKTAEPIKQEQNKRKRLDGSEI